MIRQPTLFDEAFCEETLEKDCLGISGLSYFRGFLSPDEQARIWDHVNSLPWQNDLKRQVQHYGYKYDYKARAIDPSMFVGPLPDFAIEVAQHLLAKQLVDQMPDQMIVNNYEPGQGISLHVDCEPCFGDTIVTVSLGSEYEMLFKAIHNDETKRLRLELGSVLSLRGEARFAWMHGIQSRRNEKWGPRGRRVSLTFRNVILTQERG